jgi:hypothetical protein
MKLADIEAQKPTLIGVSVKLTPREHAALKALVFAEGHTSFQSFFRSLAVEKLRAAREAETQTPGTPYQEAHPGRASWRFHVC